MLGVLKLCFGQKPFFLKSGEIDKKGICPKGRKRFIGGIALVGHTERQNLPIGKAALREKINKFQGFLAE